MIQLIKDMVKGFLDIKESVGNVSGKRKVSKETYDLIKQFEGYSEKAYSDVVGVWTIGYGNTYYKDGSKVREGDTITKAEAEELFQHVVDDFAQKINVLIKKDVNDCEFGALVSLSYNIGVGAFKKSTLLRKVNGSPDDPSIGLEFLKWVKAGGKTVNGLVKRRNKEAEFYFNKNCS